MKKLGLSLIAFVGVALLIALFTTFKSDNLHPTTLTSTGDIVAKPEFEGSKGGGQVGEIGNRSPSSSTKLPSQTSQTATANSSEQLDTSESGNKFKLMSVEEEISKVEKTYPAVLNRKGFTEHEAEVIVRLQIEEIKSPTELEESAIDKASRELSLNKEKKDLLNEAFDEQHPSS